MLSFLKFVVAMLMGCTVLGYIFMAYSVGWDWTLAATQLV